MTKELKIGKLVLQTFKNSGNSYYGKVTKQSNRYLSVSLLGPWRIVNAGASITDFPFHNLPDKDDMVVPLTTYQIAMHSLASLGERETSD